MSLNLRIGLIVVGFVLLLIVLRVLKKGQVPIKYALPWIFSSALIMLIGIVPIVFSFIASKLGFEVMSNLVIGIFIFILFMITIMLTVIVSGQRRKITMLIQEVSILKNEIKKK
jgi:hypothetical protein